MYILKYILLIAIIYVFLTYISKSKMNNEKILQIIIIAIVGMWILNNVIFKKRRKIVVQQVLPSAIKILPRSARASKMKIPLALGCKSHSDCDLREQIMNFTLTHLGANTWYTKYGTIKETCFFDPRINQASLVNRTIL